MSKVWAGGEKPDYLPKYAEKIKELESLKNNTSDSDILKLAEVLDFLLKEQSRLLEHVGMSKAFIESD